MTWCPNCQIEHLEDLCTKCNSKLEAYLTTATDDMEASILISLLTSYGIPAIHKHEGSGQYLSIYMGKAYGIKIYVPSKDLTKAKQILNQQQTTISETDPKRRKLGFIFLFIIALPYILSLFLIN